MSRAAELAKAVKAAGLHASDAEVAWRRTDMFAETPEKREYEAALSAFDKALRELEKHAFSGEQTASTLAALTADIADLGAGKCTAKELAEAWGIETRKLAGAA